MKNEDSPRNGRSSKNEYNMYKAAFEIFLLYEEDEKPTVAKGIQNIIVILSKIIFILFKSKKVYFYENGRDKVVILDKGYMLNHELVNIDLCRGASLLSKEKLELPINPKTITIRPSFFNVIGIVKYVWTRKELTIGQRLSAVNSCVGYALIINNKLHAFVTEILYRRKMYISNDPGSPFVAFVMATAETFGVEANLVCQTSIFPHSVEWKLNSTKQIFVIDDEALKNKLKEVFGICATLLSSEQQECDFNDEIFKFNILFAQQYYHSKAFKSRIRHFFVNVSIGKRSGTLTRIHPNESVLERFFYHLLSILGVIKISKTSLVSDMKTCRFALAFSSTIVGDFKRKTRRPARFLSHKNVVDRIEKKQYV